MEVQISVYSPTEPHTPIPDTAPVDYLEELKGLSLQQDYSAFSSLNCVHKEQNNISLISASQSCL